MNQDSNGLTTRDVVIGIRDLSGPAKRALCSYQSATLAAIRNHVAEAVRTNSLHKVRGVGPKVEAELTEWIK